MSHLELYTLLTYFKQRIQLSNETLAVHVSEKTGKQVTPHDLEMFMSSRLPTVKQQVQGLVDAGLSQARIVEFTGLAQSNISYHMHNPPKNTYVNPYWLQKIDKAPPVFNNTQS